MSFPTKEERAKCWKVRDQFWACLDANGSNYNPARGDKIPEACMKFRKDYESSCPAQWVKHFDRKRTYEQFKEKMKSGYDPVNEKDKDNEKK